MHKYIQPVSLTFVFLLMLLQLSGCASLVVGTGGNGGNDPRSQTEIQSDAEITRQINRAFVRDANIPAMDIRVVTFRGVVTLSGGVQDEQTRERARTLAKQVAGVRRVRVDFR